MYASNPKSYGNLESMRRFLAEHPEARDEIIACLVGLEKRYQGGTDRNLREDLSGPIVDLLFDEGAALTRKVSNGSTFHFRYSSRIAREFIMAQDKLPDHVWEPQTTRSVVALSKDQQNVIVGGAYFGDHSIFISQVLAEGGRCHCFELSSENVGMLKQNIEANGVKNIVVNQDALWSEDGKKIELAGDDSHASPSEAGTNAGTTYLSRSIDSYVNQHGLSNVGVIMLDIEGGEYAVLQGAAEVLSRSASEAPALICEIHRNYADWTNGLATTPLCKLMLDHGYEIFAIRDYQGNQPMAGKFVELVDIESAVVSGPPHGFNLLAVKSRSRLDPNVFRIVHNVSPKLLFHRDPSIFAPLESGHEMP
jgi:FkbM family methyltransferase